MFVGPIIARELLTTPRRPRLYSIRATYIGLFFVLMWTAWQAIIGFQQVQRLGDISYFNEILFQLFALTQLTLVLFASSLYGTSSVSHEKDRRTFVLLLVTRLKDQDIIVEKFLCGLLQVSSMLLAALPVFLLTALMGGVSFGQIAEVYGITFGTALASGAVGVLIATWREKTFQAVAMTMLAVVLYLLVAEVLFALGGSVATAAAVCLSPFRALAAVIAAEPTQRSAAQLLQGMPHFPARPSWIFLAIAVVLSLAFLLTAILRLRAWNPRGEPIQQKEAADEQAKTAAGGQPAAARDPFRKVWPNPVLWREIMTRAYGTRSILIKLGYLLVFGLLAAALWRNPPGATDPRLPLKLAEFVLPLAVLSLMLVNAQAATAVTAERDLKSIDLLLVTDVTAKEFVYGKLLGIFYNTKEMILGPLVFLAACALAGRIPPAGLVYLSIAFLVFLSFAALLGIHSALRYDSTRIALANSLGTMFLLFIGILVCLFLILVSGRFFEQWGSFILFIVLGSIGLWLSLRANAPSNAIGLTASLLPISTFYCIIAFLVGDRAGPFLVITGVYGFAVLSLLIPLISEFDLATGRTTAEEG